DASLSGVEELGATRPGRPLVLVALLADEADDPLREIGSLRQPHPHDVRRNALGVDLGHEVVAVGVVVDELAPQQRARDALILVRARLLDGPREVAVRGPARNDARHVLPDRLVPVRDAPRIAHEAPRSARGASGVLIEVLLDRGAARPGALDEAEAEFGAQ